MVSIASAATAVKFYSPFTGLFVVRCDAAQHRNVWAAATLLTEVRRRVVAVRLVVLTGAHVSHGLKGTACRRFVCVADASAKDCAEASYRDKHGMMTARCQW